MGKVNGRQVHRQGEENVAVDGQGQIPEDFSIINYRDLRRQDLPERYHLLAGQALRRSRQRLRSGTERTAVLHQAALILQASHLR